MFDNFSPEMTRKAVEKVAGRCETESSGGITLDTLRTYAETGVDFISVGALTHQIRSLDMSLKPASSRPQAVTARRCRSRQACEHPDRERS